MKFLKSIRFRIIVACIIFALIVSTIFGFILLLTIKINSDEQFNWHVEKEMSLFLKQYEKNRNIEFKTTRGIVIVASESKAIEQLKKIINIKNIKERELKNIDFKKYHKVLKNGFVSYKYCFKEHTVYLLESSIKGLENSKLYYFINLTGFDETNNMGANIAIKIFLIVISIIVVIAILAGFYITKKVLSPLTALAENVDKIDIGEYRSNLNDYYNDEIGFLAEKIDSFVERSAKFLEREKAFTRDASHELRTPITSSQAALDVAFTLPEAQNSKMEKVLLRIQRANRNMIHLIESFLILGREKELKNRETTFNLRELVDSSINKNIYLLNSSKIDYKNEIDKNLTFTLRKNYLSIVVDNIVRNGFIHMQEGSLILDATSNSFIAYDSGEWFDESKELGIGLSIVKRISKRESWKFLISTVKNRGTKIEIEF